MVRYFLPTPLTIHKYRKLIVVDRRSASSFGGMMKLVDMLDLESSGESRMGSIPFAPTTNKMVCWRSGLTRCPLKAVSTGSNPVQTTTFINIDRGLVQMVRMLASEACEKSSILLAPATPGLLTQLVSVFLS